MSIKLAAADAYDRTQLRLWPLFNREPMSSISLTPVFHVEQLYNDTYFDNLQRFLDGYQSLSGARAVTTCMTPNSPLLLRQLQTHGFDENRYWDRIAKIGENSIVGLHGHFVRSSPDTRVVPMHSAFFDMHEIEQQIVRETDGLLDRNIINRDLMIYSGGWWYTSRQLRAVLVKLGYSWDYTPSTSSFNISQGSNSLPTIRQGGLLMQSIGGKDLRSAAAVCSIAKNRRPYHSIGKISAERKHYDEGPVTLSLYSHDYDLSCDAGLAMVERYIGAGFNFCEPY